MPKIPIYNADQLPSSQMGVPQLDNSGNILSQAVMSSTSSLANATIASAQQGAQDRNNAMYRSMTQLGQGIHQMQAQNRIDENAKKAEQAKIDTANKQQQNLNDHDQATLEGGKFARLADTKMAEIQKDPTVIADPSLAPEMFQKWAIEQRDLVRGSLPDRVGQIMAPGMETAINSGFGKLTNAVEPTRTANLQAQADNQANEFDTAAGIAGQNGDFKALATVMTGIKEAATVRSNGLSPEIGIKYNTDRTESALVNFFHGYSDGHAGQIEEVLSNPVMFGKDGKHVLSPEKQEAIRDYDRRQGDVALKNATFNQKLQGMQMANARYDEIVGKHQLVTGKDPVATDAKNLDILNKRMVAAQKFRLAEETAKKSSKTLPEQNLHQDALKDIDRQMNEDRHAYDSIVNRDIARAKKDEKQLEADALSAQRFALADEHDSPGAKAMQANMGRLEKIILGGGKDADRDQVSDATDQWIAEYKSARAEHQSWLVPPIIDHNTKELRPGNWAAIEAKRGVILGRLAQLKPKAATGGNVFEQLGQLGQNKAENTTIKSTMPAVYKATGALTSAQRTTVDGYITTKMTERAASRLAGKPGKPGMPTSEAQARADRAFYEMQVTQHPELVPKTVTPPPKKDAYRGPPLQKGKKSKGMFDGLVPPPPAEAGMVIDAAQYARFRAWEANGGK